MIAVLREVTVTIRDRVLLDVPAWQLAPASVTAILGPNGAGKSTLVSLLAGERAPNRGQVRLFGSPLRRPIGPDIARHRAVVPQDARTEFPFTTAEVIALGRLPWAGLPHADLTAGAASALEIAPLLPRPFALLSGGERQRVLLARALTQLAGATDNALLLLDEPTSALDPYHQLRVMGLLRRLADHGLAVLAVLHDLPLAAQYADRVVLMKHGQILADGPTAQVLTAPLLSLCYDTPFEPGDLCPRPTLPGQPDTLWYRFPG